ncbi:glycoside hydrolase [Solimicrobium silvestre]|uniref:Glycosyl hydrolases related to GH101 family n=1 Tax=Solimicrobium silvestre TaxID=2099400 RepID=A0A2S9H0Z3_9BURK|nr:glycoside hydrolase [Solimicrobium silvestre]PRC93649.1 Glycosyl hydrolases related to GH101 family [Solimicrobium silvestre]
MPPPYFIRLATYFLLFILLLPLSGQALTLSSPDWLIEIDPATLSATAQLPDGQRLVISSAQNTDRVMSLKNSASEASWRLGDTGIQVNARLDGHKLIVRFSSSTTSVMQWPLIPSGARGLILPLAEGNYIPAQHSIWRDALAGDYNDIDTTEGLSLPVLGLDHGDQVLSVLFINPFHNRLHFTPEPNGIALVAEHRFTSPAPYEIQISLNDANWLAPALEYRKWLKAQGRFISLESKLAAAQDGEALIGASHAYLWGSRLLALTDVRDWRGLQTRLKKLPRLIGKFDDVGQQALRQLATSNEVWLQRVLIDNLNTALESRFAGNDVQTIRQRKNYAIQQFGEVLINPERWGEGASTKMIAALQQAGLSRLWLGLPQWEAGYAHPEAIAAARLAGYLIAPYDSYNTALPDNGNQDWSSSHLGQDAFERCGIMQDDGQRRSGFQGEGVYTNSACIRPILEQRVRDIQYESGYNSWFIDADASGMLFDDMDPAKPTSQAQDAESRQAGMAWISNNLGLVVGSENGHATVNRSIAFAHGLQTNGFGWRDPDMRNNSASPYFMGRWFPESQPQVFFRAAAIKPVYRALYFDPATRLPLFQAAFHDSIITTHHWLIDSLKFPETRQTTELLAQLYNVAPLLNLSLDTNAERLPYLKHLDDFFRPLHQRLAFQALTKFSWKNADGQVQETRFADGTRIVANFSSKLYDDGTLKVPGLSVLASMPDGTVSRFQSEMMNIKPTS